MKRLNIKDMWNFKFVGCKDVYCCNGGKCIGLKVYWCVCLLGYIGVFCYKSEFCLILSKNKIRLKE